MFITTQFSIKDLEKLSGVKAHTIRIWEKRYNLLEPSRTETNIRQYDLANLKKLLNVTYLYNQGYKISKIAKHTTDEIAGLIADLASSNGAGYAQQAFKTSMFEFNHNLFTDTYNKATEKKSFEEIFEDVLIPLLEEIGYLWQSGIIDPSHERFISELIKQKLIINISKVQEQKRNEGVPTFALFLPLGEIHELGMLYVNYLIMAAGFNTVYLGTNIPISSLKHILKHYDEINFLSYFTVKPDNETMYEYVERFNKEICSEKTMNFYLMGYKVQELIPSKFPSHINIILSLKDLRTKLEKLKLS